MPFPSSWPWWFSFFAAVAHAGWQALPVPYLDKAVHAALFCAVALPAMLGTAARWHCKTPPHESEGVIWLVRVWL